MNTRRGTRQSLKLRSSTVSGGLLKSQVLAMASSVILQVCPLIQQAWVAPGCFHEGIQGGLWEALTFQVREYLRMTEYSSIQIKHSLMRSPYQAEIGTREAKAEKRRA